MQQSNILATTTCFIVDGFHFANIDRKIKSLSFPPFPEINNGLDLSKGNSLSLGSCQVQYVLFNTGCLPTKKSLICSSLSSLVMARTMPLSSKTIICGHPHISNRENNKESYATGRVRFSFFRNFSYIIRIA